MSDKNRQIKIDELNFDGIRSNLRNFLAGQDTFKDYNFEGSALSVILDLLAYNTHYNAMYTNMALNEMFIDSASKRESVLSICKTLGYTPRSAASSKANVTITVSGYNTTNNIATLPEKSVFTATTVDGDSFYFSNKDSIMTPLFNGVYTFANLDIFEGTYFTEKYIHQPTTQYYLNNIPADLSSLEVYVFPSISSAEFTIYSKAEDIIDLDSNSAVYFVREIENSKYQLEFGDGIIGKALNVGSYVKIVYRTSNGFVSNGSKNFKLDGSLFSGGSITITTNSIASGGQDAEDLQSIKFNAPRHFSTQNRAVTENDFKNIIFKSFSNVRSIQVWGGENNKPPQYGKVFVSIQPKTTDYLSDTEKDYIKNDIIKPKSVITTSVELVDPIYLNIIIDCTIYYNSKATTKSSNVLSGMVAETILNYNETELMQFDSVFRHSRVTSLIDSTEKSIQNNVTNITLSREVTVKFNIQAQYYVDIGNPIYYTGAEENAFTSTGFYINDGSSIIYYLRDDGVGNIQLYYLSQGAVIVVNPKIGSLDYSNGIINISGLNIIALASDNFMFYMKPSSYDVVALRDQVIRINQNDLKIIATIDPVASGSARAGNTYIFTPTRK
jgi:hypothetical protein